LLVVDLARQATPAKDGPNAGHQLAKPERLDQVVIGAHLEPHHSVGLLTSGRDDQDRDGRSGPQYAAHVDAVHIGKTQIEQHHVRVIRRQRRRAGRHPLWVEPKAAQARDKRFRDVTIVLHHQHAHATSMHHDPPLVPPSLPSPNQRCPGTTFFAIA